MRGSASRVMKWLPFLKRPFSISFIKWGQENVTIRRNRVEGLVALVCTCAAIWCLGQRSNFQTWLRGGKSFSINLVGTVNAIVTICHLRRVFTAYYYFCVKIIEKFNVLKEKNTKRLIPNGQGGAIRFSKKKVYSSRRRESQITRVALSIKAVHAHYRDTDPYT